MEKIVDFIGDNYAWFLTITIILLFALIGYIVDTKRNKNDLLKKTENEIEEINLENIKVQEGKSLNDVVGTSKNINPETRAVELTDTEILNDNNGENVNNN